MNLDALFTTWDIPWAVTSALAVTAIIYVRGWLRIRKTRPWLFPRWRLFCFLGGIFAIFVAVASPLDTFSETLLFMHMAQHSMLMYVAPPLIVFGAPVVPMLRGLPRPVIRRVLRPLFATGWLHRIGAFLTRLRVAWLALALAYIGWHVPRAYEFALSSENIHNCEHACFFLTSLMFWWPVIAPWPFRQDYSRWLLIPYLMLADIVNTGLSAFLCFSGRLLYPSYGAMPRLFGLSALNDQIAAGAFMWIMGSMVFLIPGMVITMQILSPRRQRLAAQRMVAVPR
ncbi:MAG TPA: cytochrome c oxidase assembly protein [Acidobacteriaceae bacterium]|jgi:cytochrome c oxidase assembly factor CtaG|nr:cytochrome c oxidase assembly protein [Acidobacteriaceae bacterium]